MLIIVSLWEGCRVVPKNYKNEQILPKGQEAYTVARSSCHTKYDLLTWWNVKLISEVVKAKSEEIQHEKWIECDRWCSTWKSKF